MACVWVRNGIDRQPMASETWSIARMIARAMSRNVIYGGKEIIFQYDADHNRVLQTAPEGTTYYLPDGELTPGNVWHTYFEVDGQRVAEDYGPAGALKHHYFHNDDQNTIGLITDDTFNATTDNNVQKELSDVFGQPRLTTGAVDPNWGSGDASKRRYINQEDLTDAHLIDLNARLYDPLLGKFMAPDPVISDQDDSQSWNAYAYSHNKPMSKEDPTGLASCPPGAECVNVTPPKPSEPGNPGAAAFAQSRPPPGGLLHNSLVRAELRAAQQGKNSPAARSLMERGFMAATAAAVTVSNTAESIAVTVELSFEEGRGGLGNELVHMAEAFPAELAIERGVIKGGEAAVKAGEAIEEGAFSIINWAKYLSGIPSPTGPFRLLQGDEYDAATAAANGANRALRAGDPAAYAGKQIHEIQPVKFGGSPTDPANKLALSPQDYAAATTWWNQLMRQLQ